MDMSGFRWLKEQSQITIEGDKITIIAPPQSDFFNGATDNNEEGFLPDALSNAPFYHTEIEGDLVMRAKVSHAFTDVYDSASLMVMKDLSCWAKCCYEHTDFDTHAVVSVVTKGDSDDCNGCDLEGNSVWLQVCRVGNDFAFHYSKDGEHFYMMRQFHLPVGPVIKVGLLAQAPKGNGGERIYEHLTIEKKTVKNIRAGR